MKTALLTGIGGDIAQSVAVILKEKRPDIRLIGIDMHEQHAGACFVDEFVKVPAATTPEYLDVINKVISSRPIDFFVPMTEPELAVISPLLQELGNDRCITAGERVINAGIDKLATVHALKNMGLPVPWTIPTADGLPLAYPCILKNRFGSGSRVVFSVDDTEDAIYLAKKYPNAIFQELLMPADREITCAVYRKRDGQVASLLMLRRLTGGFTGWAKIIENESITFMCERIARGLDLHGSMNIQLRMTNQGPRVFEINPRLSSTALMRHRVGFSDVLWAFDEAEGKSIHFPQVASDQTMARTHDVILVKD